MEARERYDRATAWVLWIGFILIVAGLTWSMHRLDDRSERLFNVVATERACPAACAGQR